ncbi:MAG: hypothetical protein QOD99_2891 [Chthoniobacter sp.]|jgi:hypothetical protein|nr:hypothetical protein [Chthoniobacter sp.]
MNISGVENHLAQALKNLSAEWQQTCADWRDVKSQEFEKNYLEALPHHVTRAAAVMVEINALLKRVRHDCE